MAWTDLAAAFAYGSKLTSAQMQNLRDNITALANGDAGAPLIQDDALDSGISASKLSTVVGSTRFHSSAGERWYEVLGSNGTWYQCSENTYS